MSRLFDFKQDPEDRRFRLVGVLSPWYRRSMSSEPLRFSNEEIASLLVNCADEIQEYRNGPLEISARRYDELKELEQESREAARQLRHPAPNPLILPQQPKINLTEN